VRYAWITLYAAVGLPSAIVGTPTCAEPQRTVTAYSVKPSDVAIPPDVPLGEYRRTIRPYKNWTLICDENLKEKQRICNVSQSIVDAKGTVVFSWSLAATASGQPMMIVRVPAQVGANQPIRLTFRKAGGESTVKTTDCDERTCIGMMHVDARFKASMQSNDIVEVNYVALPATAFPRDPTPLALRLQATTVQAPLEGLAAALSGI
jgi:invasion protein IalB